MLGIDEITGNPGHPIRGIDSLGEGHSHACVRGHATIKIVEIVLTNIPGCADVCHALPRRGNAPRRIIALPFICVPACGFHHPTNLILERQAVQGCHVVCCSHRGSAVRIGLRCQSVESVVIWQTLSFSRLNEEFSQSFLGFEQFWL